MRFCFCDFESRSVADLKTVGLYNYSKHPTTEALLLAYAVGEGECKLWEPKYDGPDGLRLKDMPEDLKELLDDPETYLWAFNAGFERAIFNNVLGLSLPVTRFRCVAVQSRYCCLPDKLEDCCKALALSDDEGKIADGKRLIAKFCTPADIGGKETLFGISTPFFRDWERHPEDWERFKDYCKRDVDSERTILRKLWPIRMPEKEWCGWFLDQTINERGIPVDVSMLDTAIALTERAKLELGEEFKKLTGLANPNSRDQLLGWAKENGYPFGSLGKKFVSQAIADGQINDACRKAFELRKQISKTSVGKYETIKEALCPDNTIKDQLVYLGAAKTGRWASRGVQVHNLPRTPKSVEQELTLATELVRTGDYEGVQLMFGSVLDTVAGVVRSVFRAPEGKRLVVCDFSAIENRVLGWLTGCGEIIKVFTTCEKCGGYFASGACTVCGHDKHRDPYKSFGVFLFGKPYEAINKKERNDSKPGALGAGYGLGGGEEQVNKDGDTIRTGLFGYAQSLGVDISQELAHKAVKVFRDTYKEVVSQWYAYEDAAKRALKGHPTETGKVLFEMKHGYLTLRLPSGRCLNYRSPSLQKAARNPDGEDICYLSPKGFSVQLYGGKITENLCQAVARDLFLHAMTLADRAGFHPVLHVHDEAVCVEDLDGPRLPQLQNCMSQPPEWAKDLPLGAEGYEGVFYRKG